MLETALEAVRRLSPAQWCQAFYLVASAIILTLVLMPATVSGLIMSYGPRSLTRPSQITQEAAPDGAAPGLLESLVGRVTSYGQVPHAWFSHFYVVSMLWSCFWLGEFISGKGLLFDIARAQTLSDASSASSSSMALGQIWLVWGLLLLQVVRRAFEHAVYFKPSPSRMWCVPWLLGLAFYTVTSVAVWVEGSRQSLLGS